MTETFSYSRLDSFKQCPRKYAYRYIEKPEVVKKKTIESYLGTICHETVQQIYKDLRVSKLMSKAEVLALYEALWERKKPPELQIVRDRYSEENYKATGRKYVEDFYDDKHPFNDGHTIGIEKQLLFDLDENIKILGYIDRLVDHGQGRYEIVDYKTNKDLPSPEELEDNWQLPLYQIGLPNILDDVKDVSCTWYFLAHRKPMTLKKNKEALAQIKNLVHERINEIDTTKEFEPKVSALCSWCDYEPICPARKHFIQTDNLPAEELRNDDGVKLVDAYISEKTAAAAHKANAEALSERMDQYAQKNNLKIIRGTSHKINVWRKSAVCAIPSKTKNQAGYMEIVKIIKAQGLWDEYSTLNTWDLAKAINEGKLPAEVRTKLGELIQLKDIYRLYPSPLKDWE